MQRTILWALPFIGAFPGRRRSSRAKNWGRILGARAENWGRFLAQLNFCGALLQPAPIFVGRFQGLGAIFAG